MRGISRRSILLGGGGLVIACAAGGYELIQDGTLPGRYVLARLDGACGSAPPEPAGPRPVRYVTTFRSAYRHREVEMITLVPASDAGRSGLGVVMALHGAGGTAASFANLMSPSMTAARMTGCAVICVDGGDTYWHKRADGDDPLGMIVHEVLPRARAAGLLTARIGIAGESMGGYGALLLAERLAAARAAGADGPVPAAVAALSPAIFATYADAAAANRAAFDGAADFARNDVLSGVSALRFLPVWVACGIDDPFAPLAARLRALLAASSGHQVPGGMLSGCHDDAFFARTMPAALRFIAARVGQVRSG